MTEISESHNNDSTASVITDQERELAQNALTDFQKSAYSGCLSNLNKLEALRPKDLKVMHNKVVTEYYKSDLKKTELFRKSLNAICGQISTANTTEAVDDVERCVMRYNQAVLLFHTKQYDLALKVVNKLFTFVEPMEESLAHKVCLLLLKLHIVTNQPDAALSLLNYIESQFVSTDTSKITPTDKENAIKPIKEQKEKTDNVDAATDAFRIKLLKYKARIYLMTHQLKLCKKEWKALVASGTPVNVSSILLKGNLEYLRGNYRKAIKILNSISADGLEYKSSGESAAVLYYNNMACLHHAMGKPNLACFYLQKALQENKNAVESIQVKDADPFLSQPLYTLGGNKHYELMYSLGVSLLHARRAAQAFECFTESAQKLHNSPRLWLRMAECCIYSHKPTNEIDFNIHKRRKDLVQKVVGNGIYRKIILASALSKDTKYHTEGLSCAIPQPTLEFGMLCLKNALFLLPNDNNELNLPSTPMAGPQSVPMSLKPSHVLGGQHATQVSQATALEALNLKASVLAASAYTSLCLGDNVVALEHAKALLGMSKLPGAYKMLGNLYAAESLILMNKINEAIEYLKPENIQDIDTFLPIPETLDKDKDKSEEPFVTPVRSWYPNSLPTGKAVLQYNLAVAYAIRGELDKSGETLKQVWISKGPNCDVPIHVIMLALYIELQLGNAHVSKSIIKQHCPQYQ
ncbi:CCR4-NOT transcription complex subunit 10-B [Neodiprion virginianus]|uniref:CCR4-NOT transcription complex subunit 10-B n=1 Tax=Neodiprion virginianus TaxID=2961670 RepID=UPI001EE6A193|nr:CCR4-NOT transcription complex subunit 10-B [Neodiprion virginianus]XP_046621244.1 CCR4-NOT transcription complex subunit 10-B [Neodiprion virginianus]XP_046621245.1 CCR4-NOT transcription complex subunit 10-B [Neodiprion virginianus]